MHNFDPDDDDTLPEEAAPGEATFGSRGNPLPKKCVLGKPGKPFALFFTGRWRFNKARDLWAPAMNLLPLEVGCNSIMQHERRGNFQTDASVLMDCAKRAPRVRVYLPGDERLGEFADFQRVYYCQYHRYCFHAFCFDPLCQYGCCVVPHHVLRCVQYTRAENGDVIKTVDQGWLDGLYAHLLKTGELQPHPGSSPQNASA